MRRIIAAGIKQILEFDSRTEMSVYIGNLRTRGINHRCLDNQDQPDDRVRLIIIKAYNSTPLIGS